MIVGNPSLEYGPQTHYKGMHAYPLGGKEKTKPAPRPAGETAKTRDRFVVRRGSKIGLEEGAISPNNKFSWK